MKLPFSLALTISAMLAAVLATSHPAGAQSSGIGYASVAAALAGLRHQRGINLAERDGWIVADDPASHTVWSFTPPGHPAHPSVVRRQIVVVDQRYVVDMRVLCEAAKRPCDVLVAEFSALNDQLGASLR